MGLLPTCEERIKTDRFIGCARALEIMCPPCKRARSISPDSRKTVKQEQSAEVMVYPELARKGRFIGAHISAAGGLFHAFENAAKIRGNAMALFLKSQRQWAAKPLEPKVIEDFKRTAEAHKFDMSKILPHGSYLVNLANPSEEKRTKSYEAFVDELKRCEQLGIQLYNFHPGSTVGECTVEASIKFIADCINQAHAETTSVIVVLENMVPL